MSIKRTIKILSSVDNYFIMPKLGADVLKELTGAELKVLLYSAAGGDGNLNSMAAALDITVDETDYALQKLENMGIVAVREEKIKKPKTNHGSQYDNEEIADAMDGDDGFRAIVSYSADKLEKQLNRNDLNTLYALYDYYGMSPDLVCGIVEYCVSIGKRNLSYIFNTAVTMQADGIGSYEALEGYLKAKRTAEGKAGRFRKLCGIGNRELTTKERMFTDRWFGEMRLGFDLVKLAYEITVNNTGEVALPYMSKILEKWYAKGIKTVEEANACQEQKPKKTAGGDDPEIEELLMAAAQKGYLKPNREEQ